MICGFIRSKHARFADFVSDPRRLLGYLRDMLTGREARYLGRNPAGGAMIIALLTTLASIGATGYMMGMDAYFGVESVENSHKTLVNCALALITLHVSGVVFSSLRHREILVVSMIMSD
ncbi:cytochrome b/b6 domain-containing protein [Pseudogemmobacter sp. W21_MBD1_M6]|uniref:cytochrome b/b6 domain-containing protein n=1 Tax=Pseudogemmobacter sp. W21_MBD1_M6 TaxID=3240271 RepID=UPI003F9D11AE